MSTSTIYLAELRHGSILSDVAVFYAINDSDARAKVIDKWGSLFTKSHTYVVLVKEPQIYGFWVFRRPGLGSIGYDTKQKKFWWTDYKNNQKVYLNLNGACTGVTAKGV